jgi:hypothetical protein
MSWHQLNYTFKDKRLKSDYAKAQLGILPRTHTGVSANRIAAKLAMKHLSSVSRGAQQAARTNPWRANSITPNLCSCP